MTNEDLNLGSAPDGNACALLADQSWKMLIVDLDDDVHREAAAVLSDFVHDDRTLVVLPARSADEAKALLAEHPDIAVALIEIAMEPEGSGAAVIEHIRNELKNRRMRIVVHTGRPDLAPERELAERFDIDDYRVKGSLPADGLVALVMRALRAWKRLEQAEQENARLRSEHHSTQLATILTLARVAEFKNQVHSGHLHRISRLSSEIARELLRCGAYPDEADEILVERIGLASILHDVGMVSVPDEILNQNNQLLEPEELELIRNHAAIGHEILQAGAVSLPERSFLAIAADIAQAHHERYEGTGYPQGLSGTDIPLAARIVAVADVFDALITERGYKRAWPVDEAIAWVAQRAGQDFDPIVVEAFQKAIARILAEEPEWTPPQEHQTLSLAAEVRRSLRTLMSRFIGNSADFG